MDTILYYIPHWGVAVTNLCGIGNHEACAADSGCDCPHHPGPPIDPPTNGNGETPEEAQVGMLKKHHHK